MKEPIRKQNAEVSRINELVQLFSNAENQEIGGGAVLALGCEVRAREIMANDMRRTQDAISVGRYGERYSHYVSSGLVMEREKDDDAEKMRKGRENTDLSNILRKQIEGKDERGNPIYVCMCYTLRIRDAIEVVRARINEKRREMLRSERDSQKRDELRKGILGYTCCPCLGAQYITPDGNRYRCVIEDLVGPGAVAYRRRIEAEKIRSAGGKVFKEK